MTYKLTKRDFNKRRTVLLAGSAISNEHWAIRLSAVVNAHVFQSIETMQAFGLQDPILSDLSIEKLLGDPSTPLTSWVRTTWIVDTYHRPARIYQAKDGQITGVDQKYVELLGNPYELWGVNAQSPLRNAEKVKDMTFIVMPVMVKDIKPLTVGGDK